MQDLKADLSLAMLAHVQKTGQAIEGIKKVLNYTIFDDLSKHNKMFWGSDDMNEIRMKLGGLQDELIEIKELLTIDPYEGNV